MRRDWPTEALAFRASVRDALSALDGIELARTCERSPALRREVLLPALDRLGVRELDPWGDEVESAAAVLALRTAGTYAMPWPLTHELAVPTGSRGDIDGCYLVGGDDRRLDHVDVFERPVAVDFPELARVRAVSATASVEAVPLDPFGSPVAYSTTEVGINPMHAALMHMVLDGFWVAGAVGTVVDLTVRHARERHQFGTAIGRFGEIRTRLADMVLARDGLDELARYTWWSLRRGDACAADVLALRSTMIESGVTALQNGHQVLGAMGLCEEHDLAVIDRHLQSPLRRPAGQSATGNALAEAIARVGFDGPFEAVPWVPE